MLASARPYHHPIKRKDIIPTPSQPTNRGSILSAVVSVIIAIKKINRYLKKRFIWGSVLIYQEANSRIDQVT